MSFDSGAARKTADRVHQSAVVELWQLTDGIWYIITDQHFHDVLRPQLYLLDVAEIGDMLL